MWKVVINELVGHTDHMFSEKMRRISGENHIHIAAKKKIVMMKKQLQIVVTALVMSRLLFFYVIYF